MEYNILGVIDSWWGDTNRQNLKYALDRAGGEEMIFNIASEGGEVMEGLAIAALISNYKGKTKARGFGIVASIATVIMAACDEKEMTKGSFFMIHNSWSYSIGNKEELEKDIELMGKIDDVMANIYVSQIESTGKLIDGDKDKTKEEILKMMEKETWLTADEAYNMGLIDGIIEEEKEEDMSQNALARVRAQATTYKNLPSNLQNNSQMEDKKNLMQKFLAFFGFKAEKLEALELPEGETVTDAQEAQSETQETQTKEVEGKEESTEDTKMVEEMELLKERLDKLETENAELKAKAAGAPVGKTETNTTKAENSRFTKDQIQAANNIINAIFQR